MNDYKRDLKTLIARDLNEAMNVLKGKSYKSENTFDDLMILDGRLQELDNPELLQKKVKEALGSATISDETLVSETLRFIVIDKNQIRSALLSFVNQAEFE